MAMMNEMEYRTIGSALAGGYRAAVYCRLSKDDDLQGESASIANQRDMLEKYCEKQGWEVVAVYQDDGFTGLNMERPDLQRMLRAIERRQINLVITKDLSRLGRNYLQTGHLIEDFFPRNGVRYIAMNDGIDTLRDNNDIAPFKNILNEMYSKDISKKVHSSYLLKAQKGQFTGCLAPFGYRKDPEDKNHLLIDEETAPIVRLIFGYALNGHGPNYIRRRLEEEKIPCPTWWNRERGLRNTRTKWEKKDPENGRYMWDFSVIKDLLMNPVYTGAIASQKKDYRFKIGTIGEKKPEDWIVVEGCPNCGGELVFNPEKQMFSCPYCASDFTEAEMEERYHTQNETAQKEADADAKTLKDENDEAAFEEHTRLYECPSCGAQIIADETTSATFCYYCHNPVVLAGRLKGNYKPAYVLPFAVQRDAAEKEFRAWCRKRWFLPSDFRSKQQLEKMSGVYVPFWLASCLADTNMSGIGQVVKSWRDGKYQVTETTEYTVSRQAKIPFERVPADGAAKIEDALMDAIEPFPIQEMRPFSMQYLSGFLAEKYDVDWEKIVPRIQSRVPLVLCTGCFYRSDGPDA